MDVGDYLNIEHGACRKCGQAFAWAAAVEDVEARPKPGDVTLCAYCGHVMAFTDKMRMRELTEAERVDIAGDYRVRAMQWAIRQTAKKRRH